MPLIAVEGDGNTHGGGELIAAGGSSPKKVTINGKAVIVHPSPAEIDLLHPPPPTDTGGGSAKVFIYGLPVHRHGDIRQCGATTIVTNQTKVSAG